MGLKTRWPGVVIGMKTATILSLSYTVVLWLGLALFVGTPPSFSLHGAGEAFQGFFRWLIVSSIFGILPSIIVGTVVGLVLDLILRRHGARVSTTLAMIIGAGTATVIVVPLCWFFEPAMETPLAGLVFVFVPALIGVVASGWIGAKVWRAHLGAGMAAADADHQYLA